MTNGQSEQQVAPEIRVNVDALAKAHQHLRMAMQLVQSQPAAGPLISVVVFVHGAEAVLSRILTEIAGQKPSVVVPPPGLKI